MPNLLLENLDKFITLMAFLLLAVQSWSRRISSVQIIALVFGVVQTLSTLVRPLVIDHISPLSVEAGRLFYYFGFAFITLFSAILISRLHKTYAVTFSPLAIFYTRALQAIALIQVLRYVDRKLEIDALVTVYQYGIPALNVATLILLVQATAVMWKSRLKTHRGIDVN